MKTMQNFLILAIIGILAFIISITTQFFNGPKAIYGCYKPVMCFGIQKEPLKPFVLTANDEKEYDIVYYMLEASNIAPYTTKIGN